VWNSVPGLSSGVASSEGDNLEITVSAEMYQPGGSVWFRALVDGEVAEPSDVVFKSGTVEFDGVRTFTFVKRAVKAGQHIVEIQWRTGTAARIRDRTLTVYSASAFVGPGHLAVATAPSGPDIQKKNSTYEDIPGMATTIGVSLPSTLAVVFSAEASASSGRLMVRALLDGSQVGEAIFCEAGDPNRGGTRSFTFAKSGVASGSHDVRLQWKSTDGTCRLGDRTMAVSAAPLTTQRALSSADATPQTLKQALVWTDLQTTTFNAVDPVSTVAITFSAEVQSDNGRLFLRALVDGEAASPSDVTLIQGGKKWRVASHTFIVKNLPAGRHQVQIQGMVDPSTKGQVRHRSLRVLWKRRSGSDFVQPFLGMTPQVRTYRMLVIGFDPMRPGHDRPPFATVKATFEGSGVVVVNDPQVIGLSAAMAPGGIFDQGPNVRAWLTENSGGVARLGEVRYVGCSDSGWYVAPPERQGNWYWDNGAFDQMWKDALAAADPDVDFHSYDTDHNNKLETDDLLVAIVRPQSDPYGTLRQTTAVLDGNPAPLTVPVLDLYLSARPDGFLSGVGVTCHELSHLIAGAVDMYGSCSAISAGYYSIMDAHWHDTHLDPFEKMKNGMVQPFAIELTSQSTATFTLPSVEQHHQILLLHDVAHVAREYFLIENRFPGKAIFKNYDGPLGMGAVVVWQIFEDLTLVQGSAVCPGDPRFIRRRALLASPQDSIELAWADGTPVGFRVSAPQPNAEQAQVKLEKL
jgi:M6 family metalloprotease-like protein